MKSKASIQSRVLIRQLKKGNTKAQFQVYREYYKMLYNAALRIVQDTAEAEDIMQEAFLSAFDKIDRFEGDDNLGGWLKRICINKALDALRKRHLKMEDINEGAVVQLSDDVYEDIDDKIALVKKGIAQMAENHRVLITLHLIEGYSHEEIAEQLGMKHNAVRTAYSRAKKKLQDQLAEVMS